MNGKQKKAIKAFVKRRDEMLKKRSVEALLDFIATDPCYEGDPIRERFKNADPIVQEMSLCNMILSVTSSSTEDQIWAAKRLDELRSMARKLTEPKER